MSIHASDDDGTVSFRLDGTEIVRYRARTDASKPHIDRLALPTVGDPLDGRNLVLNSPHDHVWHHGVWFCQKLVDGINCWAPEHQSDESQITGHAVDDGYEVDEAGGRITVTQDAIWKSSRDEPLLADTREVSAHDVMDQGILLTWRQSLTALGHARHLTSESYWGHYSGFSLRFARSMTGGTVRLPDVTDPDAGEEDPREMSGPTGEWCDYTGPLDGEDTYAGSLGDGGTSSWTAGVTVFDHPNDEPHPPRWFTSNVPYGFVSANPTWDRTLRLVEDETVTWTWGLWVHRGKPDRERIETAYETFQRSVT